MSACLAYQAHIRILLIFNGLNKSSAKFDIVLGDSEELGAPSTGKVYELNLPANRLEVTSDLLARLHTAPPLHPRTGRNTSFLLPSHI